MQELEKLTTNLSHARTYRQDVLCPGEYESFLFSYLDSIVENITNKNVVLRFLKKEKNLFYFDIPRVLRPGLFFQLNLVLLALMREYPRDRNVFHSFFDLMSLFKAQIDRRPQMDFLPSDEEWLELQKSVHFLCHWEDSLSQAHSCHLVNCE